jgi:hypothetical protein
MSPMRSPLAFCLALALGTRTARGQDAAEQQDVRKEAQLPSRTATFAVEKAAVKVTLGYRDAVDAALTQKAASGLPLVIATRAYLLREGDANPIGLYVRTCKVTYDLWDEVYRVKVSTPAGDRDLGVLNFDGVARQCLEFKSEALFEAALVRKPGAYFVGLIAQINPVSREMQRELRAWVSRPAGISGIAPGDALFGSFVALFAQRLAEGAADRTLRLRTQAFTP